VEKKIIRINVKIDGRTFPLSINSDHEERYRLAAKNVNEMVRKYRAQFGERDTIDIFAMSAFQIALRNTEMQQRDDNTLFIEGLKNLNDDIADFLKEKL